MTAVDTEQQLRDRIEELEAELAQRVDEAIDKEQQLQRYASDLRETFMQERRRSDELHSSYTLTVRALASAVEARDAYTGRHAERVAAYGLALGEVCGMTFGSEPEIEFGFLLHDVGKVAVPDAILFKPGPLTAAERLVMQQHPVTGSEIVRDIDFLGAAREVIRSHHERWDGSGYPDGLAGRSIPHAARVFAVADTLDALTTERPYRRPSSLATARAIIDEGIGTHFDPDVIQAFRQLPDATIEQIKLRIG
jgi:response regulator RpfG family c-di-GMP phosphodiesterase